MDFFQAHLELAYQRAAEKAVQEENCFKIYIYKREFKMTIELLDTEPEDSKKVDEAKKWSNYKECYTDITRENKPRSPVYLDRNLRLYQRRASGSFNKNRRIMRNHQSHDEDEKEKNKRLQDVDSSDKSGGRSDADLSIFEVLERKLNERQPERQQTEHPGYDVNDDSECKFNMQDSKIMFTVSKNSYLYNISAFHRARTVSISEFYR